MENINNPNPDLLATEQLEVDEQSGAHLRDAGVWAKAIAITVSIFGGLAVIGMLLISLGSGVRNSYGEAGYLIGIFIGAFIVIGIAMVAIINLFKFSSGMAAGVNNQDAAGFEKGITGLKVYFIFAGVLTLLLTFISLIQLFK